MLTNETFASMAPLNVFWALFGGFCALCLLGFASYWLTRGLHSLARGVASRLPASSLLFPTLGMMGCAGVATWGLLTACAGMTRTVGSTQNQSDAAVAHRIRVLDEDNASAATVRPRPPVALGLAVAGAFGLVVCGGITHSRFYYPTKTSAS